VTGIKLLTGVPCENFPLNQRRHLSAVIVGFPSCRGRCIVAIIGDIPINGLSPFETLSHSIEEPLVSWAVMDELSMIDRIIILGSPCSMLRMLRNIVFVCVLFGAGYGYHSYHSSPSGNSGTVIQSLYQKARAYVPEKARVYVPDLGSAHFPKHPADFFQFNITQEWITRRWPDEVTEIEENKVRGYRVPLVSGTSEQDLYGSMIYYFGPGDTLSRISFLGSTGDAKYQIQWIGQQFGFHKKRRKGQTAIFRPQKENSYQGILKIAPKSIIASDVTTQRYDIHLVVDRNKKTTS